MFTRELATTNPAVRLIKPDVERDAPLAVDWLDGTEGRKTLELMGVAASANQPSSLEQETKRLQGFLNEKSQYNWMISFHNQVIGAIWVELEPTPHLPAPAVSIMLGEPSARGEGIGSVAVEAVVDFLQSWGHHQVYARYLINNHASAALFHKLYFKPIGHFYTDSSDRLVWQNVLRKVQTLS